VEKGARGQKHDQRGEMVSVWLQEKKKKLQNKQQTRARKNKDYGQKTERECRAKKRGRVSTENETQMNEFGAGEGKKT